MCPAADVIDQARNDTKSAIQSILRDTVVYRRSIQPQCACGARRQWTRIAHLNMSDPNQQCPTNLRLTSTPVRGCGSSSSPLVVHPYSRVCGRVNAYQRGSPNAFHPSIVGAGLEGAYIDGVSLELAGSRQHIWSFAGALFEVHMRAMCSNTWPSYGPHLFHRVIKKEVIN